MNLNPQAGIPITLGLVACLLGTVALAALTRPIDRTQLPREPAQVIDALRAQHQGGGTCVRWSDPETFTTASKLELDLSASGFHPDLHSLLPLMGAIRVANHGHARAHHGNLASEEFRETALAGLGRMDRMRLQSGRQDPESLVPALQAFADADARVDRDRRRLHAFRSTLPATHIAALDRLVEAWREPLAHPRTQAAAIDAVAYNVTKRRMAKLRALLAAYHTLHGVHPASFKDLLEASTPWPPIISRGIERDGSLRDGWLRPFEYYRLGRSSYRLRSQGSDPDSDEDDILVHPAPEMR
jgi:hypothetical protein